MNPKKTDLMPTDWNKQSNPASCNLIRSMRFYLELDLKAFAELMGVSLKTAYNWEDPEQPNSSPPFRKMLWLMGHIGFDKANLNFFKPLGQKITETHHDNMN